jgi:transcriptional regulator with XRE-family HTH domain
LKTYLGGITLFFRSNINNKTVKELRKNQNLTAKELADKLKIETVEILNVDNQILKDVPEPLKSKLLPILRGDYMDKIPWL